MAKTEILTLWKKKGNTGKLYCNGYGTIMGKKISVVGFYNSHKSNPKQPDVDIFVEVDRKREEKPMLSLWCNVDKNGKKYLSGKLDGVRVVGFINEKGLEPGSKYPHFSVYYSDDKVESKPVEPKVEEYAF